MAGCRFAYDGLGGDIINRLLEALPNKSTVSSYSHIASPKTTINVLNLFGGKKLETFNSVEEATKLSMYQLWTVASTIQQWMTQPEMATKIQQSYPLERLPEALVHSVTSKKTDGKIQIDVDASMK